MSCNHCTTKFNFFHKEGGCSNCGLSFCNKCLKQKLEIPAKGPGEHNICKTCYLKLSAGCSTAPQPIPPPEAYLKRLEALENPVAPPITIYKHDKKLEQLRSGLSVKDIQLLDRLEKLKKGHNKDPPPTESEIRRRLANLKTGNSYVEAPAKQVFLKDMRSDQEKVDSLLEQFVTERDIELAHNPQEEIEARLAELREQGVRPNEGTFIKNLHDSPSSSEEEVDKITKKIMDEVALEARCPVPSDDNSKLRLVPDNLILEVPWCVMCNEEAQYHCLDCGELYCKRCNIRMHKEEGREWEDHEVVPYPDSD